jgi:DnaJ-class molecular chaperone
MAKINHTNEVLSDKAKRAHYDQTGEVPEMRDV